MMLKFMTLFVPLTHTRLYDATCTQGCMALFAQCRLFLSYCSPPLAAPHILVIALYIRNDHTSLVWVSPAPLLFNVACNCFVLLTSPSRSRHEHSQSTCAPVTKLVSAHGAARHITKKGGI
eukprot:scaffold181014_cov21-Tisochrysis_lutea.AAC.1